jgi:hypothetical protein
MLNIPPETAESVKCSLRLPTDKRVQHRFFSEIVTMIKILNVVRVPSSPEYQEKSSDRGQKMRKVEKTT